MKNLQVGDIFMGYQDVDGNFHSLEEYKKSKNNEMSLIYACILSFSNKNVVLTGVTFNGYTITIKELDQLENTGFNLLDLVEKFEMSPIFINKIIKDLSTHTIDIEALSNIADFTQLEKMISIDDLKTSLMQYDVLSRRLQEVVLLNNFFRAPYWSRANRGFIDNLKKHSEYQEKDATKEVPKAIKKEKIEKTDIPVKEYKATYHDPFSSSSPEDGFREFLKSQLVNPSTEKTAGRELKWIGSKDPLADF